VVTKLHIDGEPILGFEAPIIYYNQVRGRVIIDQRERPLLRVAQLSLVLMAVLVIVTVFAVAVAMYFVANWFARPVKTISEAMDEIARGHFDHRIGEVRKDEFGLLFAAFDRMAQALQTTAPGALVASRETPPPASLDEAPDAASASDESDPEPTPGAPASP
jgi:serine/threonine-protein kinase